MSNRYILRIGALGEFPELEIDEARFERLKLARPILSHALAIEEKYEILISNYLELEREAINASVSEMVRDHIGYKDFFDIRLGLNIRFVNLLTAARLYTDQLPSHVCACFPNKDDTKKDIKKLFSTEYDSSFEYRFMVALRNYVQHSGIPIHRVATGGKWTDVREGFLEYSIYFGAQKKELSLDTGFKKQVLNEMPEEVNLRLASRSYIESISRVHRRSREIIGDVVDSSRLEIDRAIRDYAVVYEKEFVGLYAYAYQDEQKIDEVLVLLKWDDVRQELIDRNRELVNLRKRYVTGQAHNK